MDTAIERRFSRTSYLEMSNTLRNDARAILAAALAAADPTAAVDQALRSRKDLDQFKRVFVVGAGLAIGGAMARAAENYLGGADYQWLHVNVREGIRRRRGISSCAAADTRLQTSGASAERKGWRNYARRRVKPILCFACFRLVRRC